MSVSLLAASVVAVTMSAAPSASSAPQAQPDKAPIVLAQSSVREQVRRSRCGWSREMMGSNCGGGSIGKSPSNKGTRSTNRSTQTRHYAEEERMRAARPDRLQAPERDEEPANFIAWLYKMVTAAF